MGVSHSESGSLRQIQEKLKILLIIHLLRQHSSFLYLCLFHIWKHRRTGRCGVLAIATWAAWFWAAQFRSLTKKKEERKGRKGKKEKERKKEKEKKRKKREEKKGKKT